jgi:ammonium transporter, Amt family
MVFQVKSRFGYDDSLDAFGVHGAGGTLGAHADRRLCRQRHQSDLRQAGVPHGRHRRPLGPDPEPACGVGVAWGISIVGTLILLFVVDKVMGLRVTPEQEMAGLDLSQHGEEGYDFNT